MTRLVYLILGARGSGRGESVSDLIENGLEEGAAPLVLVCQEELEEMKARLGEACRVFQYDGQHLELPDLGEGSGAVFVIADGHSDPVDFVEAFQASLKVDPALELGRVITVVDCQLATESGKALHWYDGCIHFSDVVLLGKREGVGNKDVDSIKERYVKQCYPCLFEYVKKGRVRNPALILDPVPRRISALFDEAEPQQITEYEGVEITDEDGKPISLIDVEDEDDADPSGDPAQDPFLKRMACGRRENNLPDIRGLRK